MVRAGAGRIPFQLIVLGVAIFREGPLAWSQEAAFSGGGPSLNWRTVRVGPFRDGEY